MLVDTSVWIDHFHLPDSQLMHALESGQVLAHPMVIGEIACGNLRGRREKLALLSLLPQAPLTPHAEVLHFIEAHAMMGLGNSLPAEQALYEFEAKNAFLKPGKSAK